jgi:hypothetical protein
VISIFVSAAFPEYQNPVPKINLIMQYLFLFFWEGSKNKNRYRITKLILGTGFWDSGKAAKTKIDIALLS